MSEAGRRYRYVAIGAGGKRITGVLEAASEADAYAGLRAKGCSPLSLAPSKAVPALVRSSAALAERDVVELTGSLGHLLSAGADMRTALGILGARAGKPAIRAACEGLAVDIGGGAALDVSFERRLGAHGAFVGAMVAAGETSGDLGGALSRAAATLESRLRIRGRLGSILAYPLFVLASTIAAVMALLLFVVPALAPLLQDTHAEPPLSLKLMVAASDAILGHAVAISLVAAALLATGVLANRLGVLGRLADTVLVNGPFNRTACSLTFGAFASVLGGMLSAGAPISDALRLSVRVLRSKISRARLEPVLHAVRQGRTLSAALGEVQGFPPAICRMAAVGEATGSLGPMLQKAGDLEEQAAIARIDRLGQLLGPMLIVALGALVGTLMAGLLSGVSQLGQSALQ